MKVILIAIAASVIVHCITGSLGASLAVGVYILCCCLLGAITQ